MRVIGAVLLVVAATCAACTTTFNHAQDSFAPYDFGRPAQVYPNLRGEACEHRLFGIWKVSGDASTAAAVAALTRGSPKIDNLIGYQVENRWGFWLLGATSCTVVSGYPVVYKDSNPKWQLFETNMAAGKLVAQPAVSPASAMPGATAVPAAPAIPGRGPSLAPPKPGTKPAASLPPRDADRGPTQDECDDMCTKFATVWKGSDAIRSTIRGQCIKKCMKPENKAYRNCIDGASKLDDIARCNAM